MAGWNLVAQRSQPRFVDAARAQDEAVRPLSQLDPVAGTDAQRLKPARTRAGKVTCRFDVILTNISGLLAQRLLC